MSTICPAASTDHRLHTPSVETDERRLRNAFGCFATGVMVVTAQGSDRLVGVTCNSFSSVSLSPPLLLWSLARRSSSLQELVNVEHFAINVLSADQVDLSQRFSRPSEDRWKGVEYLLGVGGAPILSGALATFECASFQCYEGGDHIIFLGRVLRADLRDGDPLLFYRGSYRAIEQLRPNRPHCRQGADISGSWEHEQDLMINEPIDYRAEGRLQCLQSLEIGQGGPAA
jgi:flavin reductase (DIM6/NTAB) family NADH-FMN oxidoreductase RutF